MRDLIVDKDLNRRNYLLCEIIFHDCYLHLGDDFVSVLSEKIATLLDVPEEHSEKVYEGLDTRSIA